MTANAEHTSVETDVSAQRIGSVYAEALLDAAQKKNQAAEVGDELDGLVLNVFRAHPDIEIFLGSPAIGRQARGAALKSVFAGRASDLLTNFLQVLNEHDRLGLLRVVRNEYHAELERRTNKQRVLVRSAIPLTDDERQRIIEGVRNRYHREPILDVVVDPDLLGGLTIRVGDEMIDASVRTRIETIGKQLIERSSHEIQTGRDRFSY